MARLLLPPKGKARPNKSLKPSWRVKLFPRFAPPPACGNLGANRRDGAPKYRRKVASGSQTASVPPATIDHPVVVARARIL